MARFSTGQGLAPGSGAVPSISFPYAGGWVLVTDTGFAAHLLQPGPTFINVIVLHGASNFPVTSAIRLGPGIVSDGGFSSQLQLTYREITLSSGFPVTGVNRTLRSFPLDPSLPLPAAARTHLTALTSSLAVFTTYDPALGRELWRTDGTVAGTTLLKDINPGPASARIDGIIALGNRALVAASDGAAGHELWITDGTTAGTTLLLDINPGPASSEPRDFTLAAGKVYFSADDGAAGRELWVTDGTPAGTTRVFDLFPGPVGSSPRNMTDVRGTLFFYADDGIVGDELFSLVVGNASCSLADVTGPGGPPSGPDGLITGDDFVAFIAAFAEGRPGLADVTGIGGEPAIPDGLITGDDFIAFIAAFATGCP
jgi:ELWxxDGT repeat protein